MLLINNKFFFSEPQIKIPVKLEPYGNIFSQCYWEFQFFGPKSKISGIIWVILGKWPEFGFWPDFSGRLGALQFYCCCCCCYCCCCCWGWCSSLLSINVWSWVAGSVWPPCLPVWWDHNACSSSHHTGSHGHSGVGGSLEVWLEHLLVWHLNQEWGPSVPWQDPGLRSCRYWTDGLWAGYVLLFSPLRATGQGVVPSLQISWQAGHL